MYMYVYIYIYIGVPGSERALRHTIRDSQGDRNDSGLPPGISLSTGLKIELDRDRLLAKGREHKKSHYNHYNPNNPKLGGFGGNEKYLPFPSYRQQTASRFTPTNLPGRLSAAVSPGVNTKALNRAIYQSIPGLPPGVSVGSENNLIASQTVAQMSEISPMQNIRQLEQNVNLLQAEQVRSQSSITLLFALWDWGYGLWVVYSHIHIVSLSLSLSLSLAVSFSIVF